MAMIYAFGETSGSHFNSEVIIGFAYSKRFPCKEVPKYIISKTLEAFLASTILLILFPKRKFLGFTIPQ
jgi:aquaporin Z